jgi:hypothetical protein
MVGGVRGVEQGLVPRDMIYMRIHIDIRGNDVLLLLDLPLRGDILSEIIDGMTTSGRKS